VQFVKIERNPVTVSVMLSMSSPTVLTAHLERAEQARFEQLKAELVHAFRALDDTYHPLTAVEVIARNASTDKAPLPSGEGLG